MTNNQQPANLLRRLAAMFYDSLLIFALWMLVGGISVYANNGEAVDSVWLQLSLLLACYGFNSWFWINNKQTLGMQAWRIYIENDDGSLISLQQANIRFVIACLSFASLGLGYLWIIFNKDKKSWSDIASHSQVVHRPKPI